MYKRFIKRLLDIVFSLSMLIILSPLLAVLIVLVRVSIGSPFFFTQERPGYQEKVFKLYKFRTMTDGRDAQGKLLPDRDRLTKVGLFLRKTSLDELPELINILKGEMSFIGPRPLLKEYRPWYTEREKLRHTVRPGLTGLAQASGRNLVDWDRRFALDVEYVENLTFAMDVKVLKMTVKQVLGHSEDVAVDTNAIEGNFARIREERLARTGSLEEKPSED